MKILLTILILLPFNLQCNVYEDLAHATNGKVMSTSKEEFLKNIQDGKNRYDALINAQLVQSQRIDSSSLIFPVDDKTFGSLVIELSGSTSGEMKVLDPGQKPVVPNQETGPIELPVEIKREGLRAIVIPNPKRGPWTVSIANAQGGTLAVRLQSNIGLTRCRLVQMGGRLGHKGLFPIKQAPRKSSKVFLEIGEDSLGKKPHYYELVNEAGEKLRGTLRKKASEDTTVYIEFKVPREPFRIRIKGTDFQRVSELYTPL